MPIHKHNPCSEAFMERKYPRHTVCQVLRDTYHLTDDPQIKLNLRVAVAMAKAMMQKLRSYDAGWDKDMWDEGKPDKY